LPADLHGLAHQASLPGNSRTWPFDPELPLLTDDRPFLDTLHERMYGRGRGEQP
jgi:hypothetical protein